MIMERIAIKMLAVMICILLVGCIAIPIPQGRLSKKEKVVAAREDDKGQIVEQFVLCTEEFGLWLIGITCEHFFNHTRYEREKVFYVTSESCEMVSNQFNIDLCDHSSPPIYFPIPYSDRWIIIKYGKIMSGGDEYHDVTILVYSHKDGIIREHKINRAVRNLSKWSIDKESRLVKILAIRGSEIVWVVFDCITGDEFVEPIDGSSFNSIDTDEWWKIQDKLCEQPQLRPVTTSASWF